MLLVILLLLLDNPIFLSYAQQGETPPSVATTGGAATVTGNDSDDNVVKDPLEDFIPGEVGKIEYPLARFMTRDEQMYLRNATSEIRLVIPISDRMDIQAATLHLEYNNSLALLRDRSELRITLDDVVMAQFQLRPEPATNVVDVKLPLNLFKPGYRNLKLWVAQHYTLQCEDPAAPELWTQINSVRSKLIITAGLRPLQPTLARIPNLIDPRLWGSYRLNIVTPGSQMDDQQLRWSAVAAQGAGLRLGFKPLYINYLSPGKLAPDLLSNRDTILIGTNSQLNGYLAANILGEIKSSFVGIYPMDGDPRHFVLVISGTNEEEVTRAVTSFAFLNFPFPDTPNMSIKKEALPDFPDYGAERMVMENATYQFNYFGMRTTTIRGIAGGDVEVSLRVPPDIFASEASMVRLTLHFSHGAAMRSDSVMNIFLNDRFENVIRFRDEAGATYRDYLVLIPLRSFRAGRNAIRFSPRMTPLISGNCQIIQEENLQFTLFDDSTLALPNASHYAKMPNLRLFSSSSFPFSKETDGSEFALQVTDRSSETISSALMLAAKVAQTASVPLYKLETSFSAINSDKHLVVVGQAAGLDAKLMESAPLKPGPEGRAPYTTPMVVHPDGYEMGWFSKIYQTLRRRWQLEEPLPVPQIVQLSNNGGFGEYGGLMQFQSPSYRRTVVVLTAADAAHLFRETTKIVSDEFWNQMDGDLVVWEKDKETVRWQRVGSDYYMGSIGFQSLIEYYFSRNPIFWAIFTILMSGLLAVLIRNLLRRYREKHHPYVTG
jgi:hypothetical protein